MLFDTHAHYDDEAFDPDRELLLESLPQRGVALFCHLLPQDQPAN